MTVRRLLGAVAAAGLLTATALLGATTTASAATAVTLSATGTGADEVPAGSGEEGASVTGSFQVTPDGSLTYTVSVSGNEEDITAGHIHEAPAGTNGDVVIELDAAAINAGTTATIQIDPAQAQELIDNPADYYLNVHSPSFAPPSGNARAQLTGTADAPDTIDTGTGGQAAGSTSGTAYLAGGLVLLVAVAGTVEVLRRRRHGDAAA